MKVTNSSTHSRCFSSQRKNELKMRPSEQLPRVSCVKLRNPSRQTGIRSYSPHILHSWRRWLLAGLLGSYKLYEFLDDKSTCNRSRASQECNGGFQSARKHREGLQHNTSSPNKRLDVGDILKPQLSQCQKCRHRVLDEVNIAIHSSAQIDMMLPYFHI